MLFITPEDWENMGYTDKRSNQTANQLCYYINDRLGKMPKSSFYNGVVAENQALRVSKYTTGLGFYKITE